MMKSLSKLIILFFILFSSTHLLAQDKKWVSGNSFVVSLPIGNMESTYDLGLGFYGNIDYNINKLFTARFDLGWNTFSGPDFIDPLTGLSYEVRQSVWEFTAGMRANIAILYIEARGGYFTGVSSWGVVPAVGFRFGKFDIQGSLTLAGDNHWGGVRAAYYWGNK